MKYLLILLFFCLQLNSYSQDLKDSTVKRPNTSIEKVTLKVGTILRKEFIDLYKAPYNELIVGVLKMKDASSGIETSGIRISMTDYGGTYTSSRTYTAYIDADELPALLKFIEFAEKLPGTTETNYVEYIFNCRDLQFYAYFGEGAKKKTYWHFGVEVDKYYSGSRVILSIEKLAEIKNAILKGMEHFKTASVPAPTSKG